MTEEQKAAYINAQAVAAIAEIEGMKADNQLRIDHGWKPAYTKDAFDAVIDKYGLHHNALISFFHGHK